MNMEALKRKQWVATLCAAVVLLAGCLPAGAQIVTTPITPLPFTAISETSGSTLLIPYFEVDLGNPNGRNTIFTVDKGGRLDSITVNGGPPSLNNNVATAVLAHVTIWSDLGVPVFNFNIYLTGYDVETVNMRTVLAGTLPRTASAGQDPGDLISPKGAKSQDINFGSCTGQLPPAPLTATQISNLTALLTGHAGPTQCAGLDHSDNVARGYVTIDVVNNCTTKNAGDPNYFQQDTTLQNHLTGHVFYVDPSNSISRGGNVVHIHGPENGVTDPIVTTSGNYTFYGRLVGFTAADQKEPLSTNFVARFNPGGAANSWRVPAPAATKTTLIVWRDPKVVQGLFACGSTPSWYPLNQESIIAFDEQEHPQTITGMFPFPAATQMVTVGGSTLPVSFNSGSLILNLNTTVIGTAGPMGDTAAAQGWVQVIDGKFGVVHNAQQLDSATKPAHFIP
jgi:hypothetical protein